MACQPVTSYKEMSKHPAATALARCAVRRHLINMPTPPVTVVPRVTFKFRSEHSVMVDEWGMMQKFGHRILSAKMFKGCH